MLTNLIATVVITLSTNWSTVGEVKNGEDWYTVKAGIIQTNYVAEIKEISVTLSNVKFCPVLIYKQEKFEYSPLIIFTNKFMPYSWSNGSSTNLLYIQ